MKSLKLLFLTLCSSSLLFASCNYDLNVHFDFQRKIIDVNTSIQSTIPIQIDTKEFELENKKVIKEKNEILFSYKKEIPNLNDSFVYLLHNWYPKINQLCSYNISTNLPNEYKKVYENTNKKIDNFNFIASKEFKVSSKLYNNIKIQTFFLRDDKILVNKYFEKTIEYIKLYEEKIAPFPYKEFKIVENLYQTGYSMPTYTLIGSRLLNKEYILNQSLGHEILHQYFGNSVFINYEKGNWAEGLTTYLADDYYKKLENTDTENRKSIINQYNAFVNKDNETPIRVFKYRFNKASSMIGYSKLSFVFHMLENKLGKESFELIIQKLYKQNKLKKLGIDEVTKFIDANSKEDLKDFFSQWINKKGQIDFKVENPKSYYTKNGFFLEFDILQDSKSFFKFELPLSVKTTDNIYKKSIAITKAKQNIKLNFPSEVLELVIDKDYDLFRKLSKNEDYLSIANLMNQKKLIAIVNKNDMKKYQSLKKILPNIKFVYSNSVKFNELEKNSVIFLGHSNDIIKHFYPNINVDSDPSYIITKPHIYDDAKMMAILNIGKYKARNLMMLKHYAKYSEVIFLKEKTIKNTNKTQDGIRIKLSSSSLVSKVEKNPSINTINEKLDDKKIIYIGESHDKLEHHLNQLYIIKSLYKTNKNLAIAMEMFQKPYQKYIDKYIQGESSLNEFLKDTQYYKRWRFDFNLYKPIIDFAKENKIPIIAINIDREINKQVSKESILSLNKEQKVIVPKEIDQSNLAYKSELEKTFEAHIPLKTKSKMNFGKFYQSQLIWDEAMSENIDEYMKKNPEKTLIVLAGSGHIDKHYGIPSRVYRRNSLAYQVITPNPTATLENDIVIINKSKTTLPKEKKLGVALKSNKELIVLKAVINSKAKKLKIQKGDKIIKINGSEVKTISDIKRELYFVNDMNKLSVTVKRKEKTIELK